MRQWHIHDSVIEADTLCMAYQERPVLENVLHELSWDGRSNFYKVNHFLHPYHVKGISRDHRRSLSGWLTLCPQASELDPHEVVESLLQPKRPRDSNSIPLWMQRSQKTTASDLRIQHPVVIQRYPNHGGNMSRVGPLAAN